MVLGAYVDQGLTYGIELIAGTAMHELGHNFGLKHGSLAAPPPETCLTQKPNYVSVMGYSYQNGIGVATAPGTVSALACSTDADCGPPAVQGGDCAVPNACHCTDDQGASGGNVCYRLDYARDTLLDLNESHLDETAGVGGPAGDTDIVRYFAEPSALSGPSDGPIDWNDDGDATDTDAQGDIDNNGSPNYLLHTADDWARGNGQFVYLDFDFQCTSAFQNDGGAPTSTPELGLKWARQHHVLHPPASVAIEILAADAGTIRVALLGSARLDVSEVDPTSLRFHGAKPTGIDTTDVNGDGIPDLLVEFRSHDVRLSPHATRARLTGWLTNSRAFVGEEALAAK